MQRYCLTKAGLEAARLLAEIAFERGEFERAWAGYEVLLEVWERQPPQNYAERDAHAALVARMAEVFGLMGDGASLERIEGMLAADKDLAARSVGVGGDASSLERHVARIRAGFSAPRAEDPAELLATFGGDNTRGRMQPTPPGDPVSVEWRHKLKYDPRSRSVDFLDENNTYYVSMLVGPYAVGYKGNLLVANGYAITSLTEARGTENFVYDPYPFYESPAWAALSGAGRCVYTERLDGVLDDVLRQTCQVRNDRGWLAARDRPEDGQDGVARL